MKNDILKRLIYIKIALLFSFSYKRQKYIGFLENYIEACLLEFDTDSVNLIKKQISSLKQKDREELFSTSFVWYNILKFRKPRIEVDNYNLKEYRTFEKFNRVLQIAFMTIDYEKNITKNNC